MCTLVFTEFYPMTDILIEFFLLFYLPAYLYIQLLYLYKINNELSASKSYSGVHFDLFILLWCCIYFSCSAYVLWAMFLLMSNGLGGAMV